jgi:hypothetical protein
VTLGHWDVDRFAAAHNAKASRSGAAPRFNSLFATAGSEGIDAFAQSWAKTESFVLHNFDQIDRVLDHVERDDAVATVVVPVWPWTKFWRRIQSGAWRERVQCEMLLPPGSIAPNTENAEHCVFGAASSGTFRSELLAMRTRRLQPRAGEDGGVTTGGAAEAPLAAARVEVGEPRAGRAGYSGGGGAASGPASPPLSDGGGAASGSVLSPPTAGPHDGAPAVADHKEEGREEFAEASPMRKRKRKNGRARAAELARCPTALSASSTPSPAAGSGPPYGASP